MSNAFQLLLRAGKERTRIALFQEKRLLEYYEEETAMDSLVGAVMLGTVERVLPDMKAAFIKLGLKQNGFLPLKEQESFQASQKNAPLVTGQDVLVQVKKDPKGEKGAFLTRDIALPGQYTLLMPCNRYVGISKRIENEGERERARELGKALAKERFGLIMRHSSLSARRNDVEAETEELYQAWQKIALAAPARKAPAMLLKPSSMVETLLRDYGLRHPLTLLTDGDLPTEWLEKVESKRLSATEMEAEWRERLVERQLKAALCRRVPLDAGGDLIIDQREALQTIDVNSGARVTAQAGESLPLSQNLAAVPEIARQIRLRNLCGIILVDFIDMDSKDEEQQVRAAMEKALLDDRVKTVVHEFTHLGLLEITRKRTRESLLERLTEGCGICGETGRVFRKQ